jgi:hypothetical protein
MAIRHVVTRGYGNGTFSGTIAEVVARGYIDTAARSATVTSGAGPYTEAQIADGVAIFVTITNDQFVSTLGDNNSLTQATVDGFVSDRNDPLGWNLELIASGDFNNIGRYGFNNLFSLDFNAAAAANYDTLGDETITITIPSAATLSDSGDIVIVLPVSIIADAASGAGGGPKKGKKRENLDQLRKASQAAILRRRHAEELEAKVQAQLEIAIPAGATIEYDPQVMRIASIDDKLNRALATALAAENLALEEEERTRKRRKRDQIAVLLLLH